MSRDSDDDEDDDAPVASTSAPGDDVSRAAAKVKIVRGNAKWGLNSALVDELMSATVAYRERLVTDGGKVLKSDVVSHIWNQGGRFASLISRYATDNDMMKRLVDRVRYSIDREREKHGLRPPKGAVK
jgi:hypothetical protein